MQIVSWHAPCPTRGGFEVRLPKPEYGRILRGSFRAVSRAIPTGAKALAMSQPDTLPPASEPPAALRWEATVPFEGGQVCVVSQADLERCEAWREAFAEQCKDHRYYKLVAETLTAGFTYRYLVLEDQHGRVQAIQPCFFVEQDLLAGMPACVRSLVRGLRRACPRFLVMRMLMVGCTAGEAHLHPTPDADVGWVGRALHAALTGYARRAGVSLVVLKDFPAQYRDALADFSRYGYVRVPSMPMTCLSLEYTGFDDYMQRALSGSMRKNLRRKFKRAARAAPLQLEVLRDISPYVDEVYPLYLAVFERSTLKFARLTKEYLCRVGQEMPDRARFFVWRQSGRIIAFSLCLVHGDAIYDEYLGMDYRMAFDLHLYFYTFRGIIDWAIAHGLKRYYSAPLGYDPKLHLGCTLAPLDLYVAHTSPVLNPFFRQVVRLVQPTRYDRVLRRFPNAHEL